MKSLTTIKSINPFGIQHLQLEKGGKIGKKEEYYKLERGAEIPEPTTELGRQLKAFAITELQELNNILNEKYAFQLDRILDKEISLLLAYQILEIKTKNFTKFDEEDIKNAENLLFLLNRLKTMIEKPSEEIPVPIPEEEQEEIKRKEDFLRKIDNLNKTELFIEEHRNLSKEMLERLDKVFEKLKVEIREIITEHPDLKDLIPDKLKKYFE